MHSLPRVAASGEERKCLVHMEERRGASDAN